MSPVMLASLSIRRRFGARVQLASLEVAGDARARVDVELQGWGEARGSRDYGRREGMRRVRRAGDEVKERAAALAQEGRPWCSAGAGCRRARRVCDKSPL
jgi:hypothetical protein